MKLKLNVIFSFFLLFLLLNLVFIIPNVESWNYRLKTQSSVTINSDITDFGIVTPGGTEVYANITITYEYGRLARPSGFPFPKRKMPTIINLKIESIPEWCSAELDLERFEATINTFFLPKTRSINFTTKLTAKINSIKAPAFENGIIKLNVTTEENGNIQSSSSNYELSLKPDFVPIIEVYVENVSVDIKPGDEISTNIFVKNMGNYKISANIKNLTGSDYIMITLPDEKAIDVDEEVSFPIIIKAKESEKKINISETIKFSVSYYKYGDLTNSDLERFIYLKVNIESKNKDLLDTNLMIIIIALILIIVAILIIFYFVRKK